MLLVHPRPRYRVRRPAKGQPELSLGRGGLLSFRIGLEFAKELLAGRYLAGRCRLSASALGESELYLLRTSRAVVVDHQRPHEEKNHEQGYRRQRNAPGSP